jgi:hypothetical protein
MPDQKPTQRPTYTTTPIKSDSDSAVFLGNPHLDNLMTVVIALGAEIWSDRQRLRIVERLLEQHGRVSHEMIEQYVPSPEERKLWQSEREAMVRRVYDVMARDTSKAAPFATERASKE